MIFEARLVWCGGVVMSGINFLRIFFGFKNVAVLGGA